MMLIEASWEIIKLGLNIHALKITRHNVQCLQISRMFSSFRFAHWLYKLWKAEANFLKISITNLDLLTQTQI